MELDYVHKSHEPAEVSTPLLETLQHGMEPSVVDAVVARTSVFINTRHHTGRTALHFAAAVDAVDTVRDILRQGGDANIRDHVHLTPLHVACRRETLAVARVLLDGGAQLHPYPEHDMPIMLELLDTPSTTPAFLRLILQHATAQDASAWIDADNRTAALAAARLENWTICYEIMVCTGPDATYYNRREQRSGDALLHVVMRAENDSTTFNSKCLEYLIATDGVDTDIRTNDGETILLETLGNPNKPVDVCITWAKRIKVGIDDQNKDGSTAVLLASRRGFDDVVRICTAKKADLDIADHEGDCVVAVLTRLDNLAMLHVVAAAGAIMNARVPAGATVLGSVQHSCSAGVVGGPNACCVSCLLLVPQLR